MAASKQESPSEKPLHQEQEDLGLDRGLDSKRRIMEPDGTMTVRRLHEKSHLFHDLLAMSWPRFFGLVLLVYIALNTLFALAYMAVGLEQLSHIPEKGFWHHFGVAAHFSAQTLTTVGYGFFSPQGQTAATRLAARIRPSSSKRRKAQWTMEDKRLFTGQ